MNLRTQRPDRPSSSEPARRGATERPSTRERHAHADEREAFERLYRQYAQNAAADEASDHALKADPDAQDRAQQTASGTDPGFRALAALQQQKSAASDPVSTTSATPALCELLLRHVRQLLVASPGSAASGFDRILLRLDDATLGDTDLWLYPAESGWNLDASSGSQASIATLDAMAPQLVARFAAAGLGELRVACVERPG